MLSGGILLDVMSSRGIFMLARTHALLSEIVARCAGGVQTGASESLRKNEKNHARAWSRWLEACAAGGPPTGHCHTGGVAPLPEGKLNGTAACLQVWGFV